MFRNLDVDIDLLPSFSDAQFRAVNPRYPRLIFCLTFAFWCAVVIGNAILTNFVLDLPAAARIASVGATLLWTAFIVWFAHKAATVIRYAVREHDVIVRAGVFWKKETIQPISRVQHVELVQGPLEKRLGLSRLKLFSAGTGHFTFEIPGLDVQAARRIQQFILEKKRALDDVARADDAQDTSLFDGDD